MCRRDGYLSAFGVYVFYDHTTETYVFHTHAHIHTYPHICTRRKTHADTYKHCNKMTIKLLLYQSPSLDPNLNSDCAFDKPFPRTHFPKQLWRNQARDRKIWSFVSVCREGGGTQGSGKGKWDWVTTGECSAPVTRGTEPDTHAHPIALSGRKRRFSLPLYASASPFRSLPLLEEWKRGEWGRRKRSTMPSRICHIVLFLL